MTTRSAGVSRHLKEEVEFSEYVHSIWAAKLLVFGLALLAALVALIVILFVPNTYRAEALLAPNHTESTGGFEGLAAQYGGLASLAGISLGSNSTDKTTLGLAVLQSRKFISDFIDRHEILVPLIAADGWDDEANVVKIDAGQYDTTAKKWIRKVRSPRTQIPSQQEAYEEFEERLRVSQEPESGLVTVSIEHHSPTVARQWVEWLIEDLNTETMRQDVTEAEQAITYLRQQVESTSIAELQRVFFRLIEEQSKVIMLSQVKAEYLLRTIDPAITPERHHSPNRWLIVILSFLFGMALALLIILIRQTFALPAETTPKPDPQH